MFVQRPSAGRAVSAGLPAPSHPHPGFPFLSHIQGEGKYSVQRPQNLTLKREGENQGKKKSQLSCCLLSNFLFWLQTLCFPDDGREVVRFNSDPPPLWPSASRDRSLGRVWGAQTSRWLQHPATHGPVPRPAGPHASACSRALSQRPLLSRGPPLLGLSSRAAARSDLLWKLGTCAFLALTA